ncbi:unnamed protein product [Leuciscus chuanchicus]
MNREEKERSPQVFVVDSQVSPPQGPVRRDVPRLQLLYLLLTVALVGVLIEAVCIGHLYSRHTTSSDVPTVERRKGEKDLIHSSATVLNETLPKTTPKPEAENKPVAEAKNKPVAKPAAFLQSDSATSGRNGVLGWRTTSYPVFMEGMGYKNNSLYIQQEGYYYIFSKISHLDNCIFFQHIVMQRSHSYNNKPIELMQNSRFLCVSDQHQSDGERGNSYLGGIFRLNEGDSVFVKVNNSSLVLHNPYENFFGAFMV